MLPLPDLEVYAGLVALLFVSLPTGATLLRLCERFIGQTVALSPVERLLISFYATGGLLFVLASIPVPLYGVTSVVAVLGVGGAGYVAFAVLDGGRGLRTVARFVATPAGVLLVLGSLALLAIEVVGGSLVLPNGIDGAVDSLFVNRLLALHTVPWTLQPYATVGVVYPQGTSVWFSLPVLLLGWPIVASPVVLPPLFVSLTPAGAFCLGRRLEGTIPGPHGWMGLLFAGFFGLVASWPRLYVGGSYDFILGLPLFLVFLGFARPFVGNVHPWRTVVAFGIALGVAATVSTTIGTALSLLLLGHWVALSARGRSSVVARLLRLLVAVGVAVLFLVRSLIGIVVWWGYPGHVLTSNSVPPYSPLVYQETYSGVVAQIDPFSPWKAKVSPFPLLAVELQVLLVVGLALSIVVLTWRRGSLGKHLPPELIEWTLVGTAVQLAVTSAVGLLGQWSTSLSGIQSVSNLWELSILLFFFYSMVAVLPLVAGASYLEGHPPPRWPPPGPSARRELSSTRPGSPRRKPLGGRWAVVAAVAVLVVPLGSGLGVTAAVLPGYVHSFLLGQSNGTEDDLTVLEWAGGHLPSCSGVLVAPGSAAQFLPEYATLRIIYPTFPTPSNLTYYHVVQNLSNGVYQGSTRVGMVALGVTEVFVTGATTVTYPPFALAPLRSSSDFTLLTSEGDAFLFGFNPGIAAQGCAPD